MFIYPQYAPCSLFASSLTFFHGLIGNFNSSFLFLLSTAQTIARIVSHIFPHNMTEHKYHFDVKMACSGCSNAVNRVLKKLDDVKNIDISLKDQSVDVVTDEKLTFDQVKAVIAKTGKEITGGKVVA